jgi:hypothetical protein
MASERHHFLIGGAEDGRANSRKVSKFIQAQRCDSCPMPPGKERT